MISIQESNFENVICQMAAIYPGLHVLNPSLMKPRSMLSMLYTMGRTPQSRLLHSSNLVAIRLPVGYETWPPIGWHHTFFDWLV